jgi:hypothetical protein
MGYTVDNIALSRQYILANGVALLIVYSVSVNSYSSISSSK